MLRYLYAAVLVLAATAAHAQDPEEVKRLCRRVADMPEIVDVFMTCEPGNDRKRYADTPWGERIAYLMRCLKSGRARGVTIHQRSAVEYCYGALEE